MNQLTAIRAIAVPEHTNQGSPEKSGLGKLTVSGILNHLIEVRSLRDGLVRLAYNSFVIGTALALTSAPLVAQNVPLVDRTSASGFTLFNASMIALGISALALFVALIILVRSAAKDFREKILPQFNYETLEKSDRLKVLQVIYSFDIGGAEKVQVDILGNIDIEKFNVAVSAHDSKTKYDYELRVAVERGVSILIKDAPPVPLSWASKSIFWKLYRVFFRSLQRIRPAIIEVLTLKSLAPEVIHFHGSGSLGYVIKKLIGKIFGAKIITTYHAFPTTYERMPDSFRALGDLLYDRFAMFGFKYLDDVVIALTDAEKRAHIANGIPESKIQILANGIDLSLFEEMPSADEIHEYKVRFGIPGDAFVIGTLGRMHPVKGQRYLAEALPLILEKVPNAYVVIFGGEKGTGLHSNDRLKLAGMIEHREVPKALGMMDLFALPSLMEAQPLSMIEAMASGTAVVASNVGGVPATLGNAAGIAAPSQNSEILAAVISDLANCRDTRERMGQAGRKRAFEQFSLQKMVRGYEDLYQRSSERQL